MDARSILTPAERRFLARARRATLATTGEDGRPRLVPICFVMAADDAAGRPVLASALDEKPKRVADVHRLARVRDIVARPEVTLLADRWDEDWGRLGWLRVRGLAELVEPHDPAAAADRAAAITALRAKYPQYAGHDLEARPLVRIVLTDAASWGDLEDEPTEPTDPTG